MCYMSGVTLAAGDINKSKSSSSRCVCADRGEGTSESEGPWKRQAEEEEPGQTCCRVASAETGTRGHSTQYPPWVFSWASSFLLSQVNCRAPTHTGWNLRGPRGQPKVSAKTLPVTQTSAVLREEKETLEWQGASGEL